MNQQSSLSIRFEEYGAILIATLKGTSSNAEFKKAFDIIDSLLGRNPHDIIIDLLQVTGLNAAIGVEINRFCHYVATLERQIRVVARVEEGSLGENFSIPLYPSVEKALGSFDSGEEVTGNSAKAEEGR